MVSGIRSKSDNDRHSSLCHHHLLHTLCVHKTLFFFLVYYCFSVLSATNTATVGISPHLHIIGHLQYPDGYFVIRITPHLLLLSRSSWSSGSLTTMARNADEVTKDGSQTTKKSEKRTGDLMATTFTANGTLNNSPADVNPFWNSQPRQPRTFPTSHRIHFCLPKWTGILVLLQDGSFPIGSRAITHEWIDC